jgi:hypothetical protein
VLGLDGVPHEAAGAFNESELVREAAFKQNTYAKVAAHVGHCYQRHVLRNAQVHQVIDFGQDKNRLAAGA